MHYADSITDLIGDTPLVKLHRVTGDIACTVLVKLEYLNPGGSAKDRIAERIVQLNGSPNFNPATLTARSHAEYDDSSDLRAMLRANLRAERVAVEAYRQMIRLIDDKDPTTRRMLEEILSEEEEHADEISDWLER